MNKNIYHHERIIVIGAGMSGLACARELQHRGFPVLVVEARSRVGGRLNGAPLALGSENKEIEHPIDLGGALIHGVNDNPLTSIVQDLGLAVQQVQECLLFQNGWPIDPKDDARISSVFNECLEEAFERCKGEDKGSSFGELFQEVCAERSVNFSSIFRWHKANLEVSCGASFHDLGWKWNEDEPYGYDGEHVALKQSWKAVVDCLAEGLDILYDAPVQCIHIVQPSIPDPTSSSPSSKPSQEQASAPQQKERCSCTPTRKSRRLMHVDASARRSSRANLGQAVDRYTVEHPPPQTPKRSRSQEETLRPKKTIVQVHLKNGTVLEANHVVCTLPLAILKSNMRIFDPPLPSSKQRAIQRLGAGLLNKCALSFPHVFWQESDFMGLAAEKTSHLILNVHTFTGKPILAFLFGGSLAKEVEDWTDRDVVADCMRVLKKICGRQIPDPIDYRVTRWGHEEFSKMAFTYIPPSVDGFTELRIMGEPVYDHTGTKPSLMFAGEHTSPFHPSTIHGAFLSGIREAYRLDLTLYPQANEELTFSDSELYQRTFQVKRRYFGNNSVPIQVRSSSDPPDLPANRRQHRQRGAACVMKLRKRPDPPRSTSASFQSPDALDTSLPARRSPRAFVPTQKVNLTNESANGVATEASSDANPQNSIRDMTVLEDATLARGIESYGNDYEYLLEKLVPVYGSDNTMTLHQLRKRCRQLRSLVRKGRVSSTLCWKRWVARTVYPSDTVGPNELDGTTDPGQQATHASQKTDDGVPETISVKTRAGRLSKKPETLNVTSFT